MGKIRVSTLGGEEEKELRQKQKVKREEKKKREQSEKVHVSGMKGGERIKSMGASEEEVEKMVKLAQDAEKQPEVEGSEEKKKKERKKIKIGSRGRLYKEVLSKIDRKRQYPIKESVSLLRSVSFASFGGSVELHINTIEKGLRGTTRLPHGTGKQVRVAIADNATIDELLAKIEKGTLDFDMLVAHPQVMGKLARVAKVLGPRGLMPNPKNGTISATPEKVADKLKGGEFTWKTESDFPIIHQVVGKLSFKDNQLEENIASFIQSIGPTKIKNATLKSTMSPGIKLQIPQ